MKKAYCIMFALCAGTVFNSCELDEVNPSAGDAQLTNFDVWKGLQSSCYIVLNSELYTSSDWLFVSEVGTDLWLAKSNGTGTKELLNYEALTTSTNNTNKLFKQCYAVITTCNTVINEAANVTDGDPETIKTLVAETKTLRAFFYSILVSQFGPVTLILDSNASLTGNVELYPKRSSEKAIYEQIVKDLTEAIADLPVEPYGDNYGRFSKKSAKGLLARVYAQRAGLGESKYGDAQTYWKLAAETAEDLINNAASYNAYLYPDIADMWADANNRKNKEALMVVPGADSRNKNYQYVNKNNKLSAYSCGGSYEDFFNSNHKPGDKGYYYGRLNSQTWMPSKYLMYCFNPEWDRRWEYSFQYAWHEWTMVQCGWVGYEKGVMDVTMDMARKYGISKDTMQYANGAGDQKLYKLYPYGDCDAIPSADAGNQYPAKIWPKGEHSGDPGKLLTVAPSSDLMGTDGYAQTTKCYAIPYPVALDDDRMNTVFVHKKPDGVDMTECPYVMVELNDLYDANGMPYGGVAQGSEAGNPPKIGNGKTSASACPGLNKFNWSYEGVFVGSNLQIKNGDMYIMRMAEVYLIAAEARQMLGEGVAAANWLNVLRQRAARPGVPESEWRLATATEDDVLDEYARELCGEFTRWALLKRHNAFEDRLQRYNKRAAASFKPYHYNRPISYDFLSTILNREEYGDNGYGSTAASGLDGIE